MFIRRVFFVLWCSLTFGLNFMVGLGILVLGSCYFKLLLVVLFSGAWVCVLRRVINVTKVLGLVG